MARPRKAGMTYFPHDCDASNDDKIEALRAVYGNDGYAFYFILLERVFSRENPEINLGIPAIKLALIKRVGVSPDLFDAILTTALEIDAFDKDIYEERQVLTSKGIRKRFDIVEGLRAKWRDKKVKEIIPRENQGDNMEITPQSKSKSKKENINNIYSSDSAEYLLAEFLFTKIRVNNSTFKEPNFQKWARDIDLMIRIDNRPQEEVREIIDFAQSNDFWKPNILSAGKLRKQYDTLKMQRDQALGKAPKDVYSQIAGEGVEVLI